MKSALMQSEIPGLPVRRGKVRDVYQLSEGSLLIVASDRISAFDVIMPTGIPDKGRLLTGMSNFWFRMFKEVFGPQGFRDHLLETDVAKFPANLHAYREQLEGRAVVVRKTKVLPIECVVRGYITGSGWKDYRKTGVVSGITLPEGLQQCQQLPEPIFTPSTKAETGHDEPISFDEAARQVGYELMTQARDLTIALYKHAAAYARTRGIIIADTKFEFGTHPDVDGGRRPILIDEALTPDSSRFWPADHFEVGRDQPSFDKQYLRNYLETLAWNKTPPGPVLPEEVVNNTRSKYCEAFERLTGSKFPAQGRQKGLQAFRMQKVPHIDIVPAPGPIRATVMIPGSKSITNRALPLAALAEGETELTGVLFADDTWQMMNALQTLGYGVRMDQKGGRVRILGLGREIPPGGGRVLSCGNSGTTIRFLAAMLALGTGEYVLDGIERMRQRPIDQLVEQLRVLGAEIEYEVAEGFPPIRIRARGLGGGGCQFADAKSSQYISAVLMAAPYAKEEVTVSLVGPVTSEPYVVMTLRMMEQFGVHAEVHDQCGQSNGGGARVIRVPRGVYRLPTVAGVGSYAVEPDASNASYFLAAGAVVPGSRVTVAGLRKGSLQGDVAFADVLGQMGATVEWLPEGVTVSAPPEGKLRGVDLDMNAIPDMVQTLAVAALFAEGPTTVRNVWNLRVKETDRLAALETELKKMGAAVETGRDWIHITPPPAHAAHGHGHHALKDATIKTYDDHRMAMAFAVAGLRVKGVRIEDPGCTAKTYPEFFEDLQRAVTTEIT